MPYNANHWPSTAGQLGAVTVNKPAQEKTSKKTGNKFWVTEVLTAAGEKVDVCCNDYAHVAQLNAAVGQQVNLAQVFAGDGGNRGGGVQRAQQPRQSDVDPAVRNNQVRNAFRIAVRNMLLECAEVGQAVEVDEKQALDFFLSHASIDSMPTYIIPIEKVFTDVNKPQPPPVQQPAQPPVQQQPPQEPPMPF